MTLLVLPVFAMPVIALEILLFTNSNFIGVEVIRFECFPRAHPNYALLGLPQAQKTFISYETNLSLFRLASIKELACGEV